MPASRPDSHQFRKTEGYSAKKDGASLPVAEAFAEAIITHPPNCGHP